ncbi:hypothetical protein HCI99_04720 [Listeria booriae]|uniref:Uncharacterized protein n=1 Tax=Listeria booriae TaxID=1552123 RepID=A0A7X0XBB5_9LIST|nr:hypothetical protein [Listeria booriae]MBC1490964.1 hypothetical protein [Listeria booriae]MBC1491121.1 hypothetical protein [Listeria booriae]
MTVGELIERLKELHEDAPVAVDIYGVKLWAEQVTTTTIGKVAVVNIEAGSNEK